MTTITAKRIGTSSHKRQSQLDKVTKRKRRQNAVKYAAINVVTVLFALASIIPQAAAQVVQTCSCSPLTYRMVFDFSKDGCPLQIADTRGIKEVKCDYEDIAPNFNGDFRPVVVTSVFFLELDLNLDGKKFLSRTNTRLQDGDLVEYESVTSVDSSVITGGVQGSFTATNQANQTFTLDFLVRFSNLCEILPFNTGDRLGYFVFSEIDQPRAETCNFSSDSPTDSPTIFPTDFPSSNPSPSPSSIPTTTPSSSPSENLTSFPSASPTDSPSFGPTKNPTPSPTEVHSGVPSSNPTMKPTASPSMSPTDSPSFRPTKNPTPSPTEVHSGIPSSSPTEKPTASPSISPTDSPSLRPTKNPTPSPTEVHSSVPSSSPTKKPSASPVGSRPSDPSAGPTASPTKTASSIPSIAPTLSFSLRPSESPSSIDVTATPSPTIHPTASPIVLSSASPTEVPTLLNESNPPTDEPSQAPSTEEIEDCYQKGKGKGYLRDQNEVSGKGGKGKKKGKKKKKCKGKGKGKSKKQKKGKKSKKKKYETPSIVEPSVILGIPMTGTLVTTNIPNQQGLRGVR